MSQEEKDLKALQSEYEQKFGSKPHYKWGIEKLQEKMLEDIPTEDFEKELKDLKSIKLQIASKDIFMGVEIDPKKNYEFKLKHRQNPRTILSNEGKCWDDITGSIRLIRLCSTESSPFVDEQGANAQADRNVLCFTDGILNVSGQESTKIKYLLVYDGYDKKAKVLEENSYVRDMFELVDPSKIANDKLEQQEKELEAKILIKSADKTELSNFLRSRWLEDVSNMTDEVIKSKAYEYAVTNASIFLEDFTNPIHKIKGSIQQLFAKQLLDDTNGQIKWTDTKGVVLTIDPLAGVRADEALARWILIGDKDAKDFEKTMTSKLN